MSPATTVLAVSAAYLVACVAIGSWPGRRSSPTVDGWVAGDRGLGLVVMYFITGATIFSAFAFLGAPGWAYSRGASVFYILGYGALGFLPFYFLGPRAARVGRAFGFVTQAQMVAARFRSPALAGLMALISLYAFVPYLALQMRGAGTVLEVITDGAIGVPLGAAIVYGVVLVYVLRSGVLGVGWTNTFQGVFMMVLAWALGLYLPTRLYGGVGEMFASIAAERPELLRAPGLGSGGTAWSWGEYSTAVLISVVGFSFWPHLFMKAFTARDERTLRRTVVLYPTFQIFLVPVMLIGFAGVLYESAPERADQILPHLLMGLDLPPVLVGLFCAGALAASMSSGDAMAHAAASITVRDGWVTALKRPLAPDTERKLIRIALLGVMAASYVLAVVYRGSLVDLLLFAYGPIAQFAPAVTATLVSRRATAAGVLSGLAAGIAVSILFAALPELRPWPWKEGIYGLIANVAVLVAVSAATRGGRGSAADALPERFLRVASGADPAAPES